MKPKVVILTAGKGSRLNERTKYFNKALLRIGNLAAISHIIHSFDDNTEFVIALGYKGDIVKQYLEIVHSNIKFDFIYVDKYSEPGSGPGYAILKCKEKLQCPFYFFSCDSILVSVNFNEITKKYSDYDVIFCNEINKSECEKYCTLKLENCLVSDFFDKSKNGTNIAFTGVSLINDYIEFWKRMNNEQPSVNKEIQIAPTILKSKPFFEYVEWYDIGNEEGLQNARKCFKGFQNLDKLDEELYIDTNHNAPNYVIKYFHNSNIIKNRLARTNYLTNTVPEIISSSNNFYKYEFVKGKDLFHIQNYSEYLKNLLYYTKGNLWKDIKLDNDENLIFEDVCKKFYYDKTISRIKKLEKEKNIKDESLIINDILVPKLDDILNTFINWSYICKTNPSGFHGDYNFSNIIFDEKDNIFKFIDWRQDFGGIIEYGDKYYDFAKMYHSFLFPHPSVKNNKFYIKRKDNKIKTFIEIPFDIECAKDIFEEFITEEGYDLLKVKILTAIVLLNMSPLHESPIDQYLYYFGKYYLYITLRGQYDKLY